MVGTDVTSRNDAAVEVGCTLGGLMTSADANSLTTGH